MPNKLTSYLVGEVSLVDRGANLKPRFSVTKEKDMPIQAVLQTKAEGEDKFLESLKPLKLEQKAIDAAVAQYRLSTGFKDVLDGKIFADTLKAAGIELPTADPKADPAKSADPAPTKKELDDLPEAVKKKLEAMDVVQKQYETMVETLKTERDTNRKAEFVRKAKDDFTHVPGNADDLGKTLYEAYEVSKEFGEKIEKQFTDAQAALKSSALFARAGMGGDSGGVAGDAWGEIEKKAEAMVQKSQGTGQEITTAKAVSMYLKTREGKIAYEGYLAENPLQVH